MQIKVLLGFIFFLAVFLRFWNLSSVPPSLYWDEVSQAYNSYSILTTGRDEHEEFLPLARFKAFGDYKAPVNIYLDVPFIALLGKTELAVRFPSAVLGSLTVLLVFFLARELFYSDKRRDWIGLTAAFFLSISPWHIQLSRAAYEGNIATFFTVLGVILFLWSIRNKSWVLILSSISFALAFYSFNAHRVFVPLLVLMLVFVYKHKLLKLKRYVISSSIIGLILLIPFTLFFMTPESRLRFQEVNIFSDISVIKKSNELIAEDNSSSFSKVVHNRRVLFAKEYVENYFDFFNPSYLFFTGDKNPRFSDQENGELYLFLLPFLLIGFYQVVTLRSESRLVLLGWFFLAPLAAATARETPHALRSETFIPTYELIAALGTVSLLTVLNKKNRLFFIIGVLVFGFVSLFSVVRFLHNYLVHNPLLYSQDWQYGYKEAVMKTKELENKYNKIYFTDTYGRAYIYLAWYGNIEPTEFWNTIDMKEDTFGFYNVASLGKYSFVNNPKNTGNENNVLYVTTPDMIPSNTKVIGRTQFLSGKDAFIFSVPVNE